MDDWCSLSWEKLIADFRTKYAVRARLFFLMQWLNLMPGRKDLFDIDIEPSVYFSKSDAVW